MTTPNPDDRIFVLHVEWQGNVLKDDTSTPVFETEDEAMAELVRLSLHWNTPDIKFSLHTIRREDYCPKTIEQILCPPGMTTDDDT
jgi:hypothetical protein